MTNRRWFASLGFVPGALLPPGPDTDPLAMTRLRTAVATGRPLLVTDIQTQFPGAIDAAGTLGDVPADAALIVPLTEHGQSRQVGAIVLGISPYREFDSDYRSFFELTADQVSIAITDALAYEAERHRAETPGRPRPGEDPVLPEHQSRTADPADAHPRSGPAGTRLP